VTNRSVLPMQRKDLQAPKSEKLTEI
jgi:hypothetical protein